MKKYWFFVFIIFISFRSIGQQVSFLNDNKIYLDSLENVVKTNSSDSLRCLNSYKLSRFFLGTKKVKESKAYLDTANTLSRKSQFLTAVSQYYNAHRFLENNDIVGYEKALRSTYNALKKYNNRFAFRLRVVIIEEICIQLEQRNNEKESMQLLLKEAIPLAEKADAKEIMSDIYLGLAMTLMNRDLKIERQKARNYLKIAQDLIEKTTENSTTRERTKLTIYLTNAENETKLKQFNNAKVMLDKAFALLSKYPKSNMFNMYYFAEGVYYTDLNQHEKALLSYEKGIKSCLLLNDQFRINDLKNAQNDSYFALKKYKESKENLEYRIKHENFTLNRNQEYRKLARVYALLGDRKKACLFYEKHIVLNDSLNNSNFENEIVTLDAKFNKVENEKKISQLLAQKEKSELVAKNDKLKLLLLGLTAIILLISTVFFWKYYQNQKKLNTQKELNFKQELQTLESKQELAVSNALLEGEEVERKRLARDLHDGLGSMLSGIKLYMSKLSIDTVQNSPVIIENVNNQLDNSIKELRHIAQNMMPESLLKLGLEASLKDLCLKFNSNNLAVEFQYYPESNQILESKQIIIYRIVQELIHNVVKHAKASQILVSCSQSDSMFLITVEDNGVGFDSKKSNLFDGMGLKNIKNRVEFMKGKLDIDSQSQKGSVFNIELNIAN
jgi:two-component system, NarL family, sensor kinase